MPVRSSLLAVTVAVAALVGTLSFAASLDHLLGTPRLYGWNWDAHVTTNSETGDADGIVRSIAADARVEALAASRHPAAGHRTHRVRRSVPAPGQGFDPAGHPRGPRPTGAERGRPRHRDPSTGPCPRGLDGDDPDHRHRPQTCEIPGRGSGSDPTPVRHGPSGSRRGARLRGREPARAARRPPAAALRRRAPSRPRRGPCPDAGRSRRAARKRLPAHHAPAPRPTSSTSGESRTCR